MKRIMPLLVSALVLISVLVPVVATARESDTATSSDAEAKKTTIQERIQKRNAAMEKKLTQAQLTMVKNRCAMAKGMITSVQARTKTFKSSRVERYETAVTKLSALSAKLKAAGIDTTAFDTQVAEAKKRAETFEAAVETFKQSVDDLAAMDCAADPEGFVATIRSGVDERKAVLEAGRSFRTYIRETLKPTLKAIRTELAAKKAGES